MILNLFVDSDYTYIWTIENLAPSSIGTCGAKTGPLLGVWHRSSHPAYVLVHSDRSLVGMRLARHWFFRDTE